MKNYLTVTDKKIEAFISEHSEIVLSSSIHTLAEHIGVSPSSISKYIKKIG
jgi:phosphosugar-binding transcriptional regulator